MPSPRRYALVPLVDQARAVAGTPKLRRYKLARLGTASRSALGVDRHERLEQVAAGLPLDRGRAGGG